jgi:ATP-binding protein involved in chromosome partitioning
MTITKEQILGQLRHVVDPQVRRDIVTLGWVQQVAACEGVVSVEVKVPPAAAPGREQLREVIDRAVRDLGDEVRQVAVNVSVSLAASGSGATPARQAEATAANPDAPQDQARANNPLPNVKHIVAVGAGKGGVGKSTIAVNLAVGLARAGNFVGLLDADIYGPSLPTMLGLHDGKPAVEGNMLQPFCVHGLEAMTIGALVEEEKPLIWRGPMAHGAFRQLVTQTAWGELDYLILDLPPGTGDVPLTMAQLLPLTGAVVVCTPQKVAQDDARRAVRMFQQLGIEVLGIVENMSHFIGDDGKEYDLFGKGGAEAMAGQMGLPFLGRVPISMPLRRNCDAGDPVANFEDETLSPDLEAMVRRTHAQVRVIAMSEAAASPTLTIT